jgi:hypothetical protein
LGKQREVTRCPQGAKAVDLDSDLDLAIAVDVAASAKARTQTARNGGSRSALQQRR